MTRVLLVDDHPMIGAALEMLLRGSSYELLGRARSAAEANREVTRQKPDLILLDVNLPDGSGLDVLRRLSRARARPRVILLTAGMDESQLLTAADLNPEGMVLKTSDPEAIATAIRQAFEPSIYLARPQEHPEPAKENDVLHKLTRRELEILQLVSGGRSNREVAEILWVADQTVKFHLANIYRKLGVGNRFEAARWARESGILDVVVEADPALAASDGNGNGNGGVTRALVPLRSPRPRKAKGRLEETSR